MGLEKVLRIDHLQQWYGPFDPAAEGALYYNKESMSQFVGIHLNEEPIPDETTME